MLALSASLLRPNMTWLQVYKDLVEDKKTASLVSLIEDIERRLHYEVLLIFGLQARLGRNLENIRSVTAAPDPQRITPVGQSGIALAT